MPVYNRCYRYISTRTYRVRVAVRYKRQGRRRIGTTGYRGRIAGVAARGLVGLYIYWHEVLLTGLGGFSGSSTMPAIGSGGFGVRVSLESYALSSRGT
jgi:hypothetical protein